MLLFRYRPGPIDDNEVPPKHPDAVDLPQLLRPGREAQVRLVLADLQGVPEQGQPAGSGDAPKGRLTPGQDLPQQGGQAQQQEEQQRQQHCRLIWRID